MIELAVSFMVFTGAMIFCIIKGYTMVIALFVGLASFTIVGIKKGFSFKNLCIMGKNGLKDAILVVEVMLVIGFITAIWRSSGTIAFFVYYGIKVITPNMFLIITFLLCCLLSYALGTSFGVAGTVGVIFMALARSGGVNEIITAAAVMSGIYFGDRGSPVSSSAILVATITHTEVLDNVKMMTKTGTIPFFITLIIYAIFSIKNPVRSVDDSFMNALQNEFSISWICILPAICMVVMPLVKIKVLNAMFASIGTGFFISIFVEKIPFAQVVKFMITGYESKNSMGMIMNGGGLLSMIEVVCIVALSSTYSGIFTGTDMLGAFQNRLTMLMEKIGRFGCMVIMSFGTLAIFCNQTIASMMCCDVLKKTYKNSGASDTELAIDIENSVILLAGTVPWAIACSVPLQFMQVDYSAIPLSFFLFLTPICYGIQKKVANPFKPE